MSTVSTAPRMPVRLPGARARVTNVELLFDLVFVLAVTQLSHRLVQHPTWPEVARCALLFALVWLVWIYTAWVTNWLDPDRLPVRAMLLLLVPGSLVLSAGLPRAFDGRGLWVGGAFAAMQVGRSAFAVAALRGERLQANFQRILAWCCVSGALALAGGVVATPGRYVLWSAAVAVDLAGGLVGFPTPWLGRSTTAEWTIDGNHLAERCSAFVLIALGESIVVTGESLSDVDHVGAARVTAFAEAVAGVVLLWWLYFDRAADAAAEEVTRSADPGRLGRSAYHLVHPAIVAGIVVTAAADERLLDAPASAAGGATGWLMLGGTALFVAAMAVFKAAVWRRIPPDRVVAVVVLLLLLLVAPHVAALVVGALAGVVILALCVRERAARPRQ